MIFKVNIPYSYLAKTLGTYPDPIRRKGNSQYIVPDKHGQVPIQPYE